MTSCAWTEPEMARLKEMVEKEMSAAAIASALCREFGTGRSRNAVIGKIKRGNGRWGRLQHRGGFGEARARPTPRSAPCVSSLGRAKCTAQAAAARGPLGPVGLTAPLPSDPPAPLPATVPMRFIDAVFADRCLHFVGDRLGPDGPDMPVCGAERAQHAHRDNRYCCLHIASGREAVPA